MKQIQVKRVLAALGALCLTVSLVITQNIKSYARQEESPKPQAYTVTFRNENGGVIKEAAYAGGETIGSKINPLPAPAVENAHHVRWSQLVSIDTTIHAGMDIYPIGYRTVHFQKGETTDRSSDQAQEVQATQRCRLPDSSVTASGASSGGVTTETRRELEGWYEGAARVGGRNDFFLPLKDTTTLTPKFHALPAGTVTVIIKPRGESGVITLQNVSLTATVHLGGVKVLPQDGKNYTGWKADVGNYTCGTSQAELSQITGLAAGGTVTLTPIFHGKTYGVTFSAPFGFATGIPPANSAGEIKVDVKHGGTVLSAGIVKDELNARVKLPDPTPSVSKEILYEFKNEWMDGETSEPWNIEQSVVVKPTRLVPMIDPPEEKGADGAIAPANQPLPPVHGDAADTAPHPIEPEPTKLPYSGAPNLFAAVGVALFLPWLSTAFYQKFKRQMLEHPDDTQN